MTEPFHHFWQLRKYPGLYMLFHTLTTLAIILASICLFPRASSIDSRGLDKHVPSSKSSATRSKSPSAGPMQRAQNIPHDETSLKFEKTKTAIPGADKASAYSSSSLSKPPRSSKSEPKSYSGKKPFRHPFPPPFDLGVHRPRAKVEVNVVGPAHVETWKHSQGVITHSIPQGEHWRGAVHDDKAAHMIASSYLGNPSGRVSFSATGYNDAYGVVRNRGGIGRVQSIAPNLQEAREASPGRIRTQTNIAAAPYQKQKVRGVMAGPGQVVGVGRNPAFFDDLTLDPGRLDE